MNHSRHRSDGVGLSGLFSGPGRSAKVTDLWVGEICAFR